MRARTTERRAQGCRVARGSGLQNGATTDFEDGLGKAVLQQAALIRSQRASAMACHSDR